MPSENFPLHGSHNRAPAKHNAPPHNRVVAFGFAMMRAAMAGIALPALREEEQGL